MIAGREPAYHYATGFFLLAGVSPLVQAGDAADPQVVRAIAEQNQSEFPLANEDFRNQQLWDAKGLVIRLKALYPGDPRTSNLVAEGLASAAIRRNPAGFLKLGFDTYLDYWRNLKKIRWMLPWENGSAIQEVFPAELDRVRSAFGVDVSNQYLLQTPSRRFHLWGRGWHYFLLAPPFLGAFALWFHRKGPREASLVAALFLTWSCLVIASTCMGTVGPFYRYLHPLSFTGLAAAAFLIDRPRRTNVGDAHLSAS